jgi:alkylation response protein AidB-like acyl-CoA dehydrogenase
MDARLSAEQLELKDAAAKLADDLGPRSVLDLDDEARRARLEKAVAGTGWRTLRSDGASGVEVALVAEEFARGLVDVPFLGPVLADALAPGGAAGAATIIVDGVAADARGYARGITLRDNTVLTGPLRASATSVDLTRTAAVPDGPLKPVGQISAAHAARWRALALVLTSAEMLGAARAAQALACDYAKVRTQYGKTIGSYQAVSHPLAEGLALIEGSISVLRYAAWAVDALTPAAAIRAAKLAKVYCAHAARTICETSIQVHGGIGNTWDCLAHVCLRHVLAANGMLPVRLEEITGGLS